MKSIISVIKESLKKNTSENRLINEGNNCFLVNIPVFNMQPSDRDELEEDLEKVFRDDVEPYTGVTYQDDDFVQYVICASKAKVAKFIKNYDGQMKEYDYDED